MSNYHPTKQNVKAETLNERITRYINYFSPNHEMIQSVHDAMLREINEALEHHRSPVSANSLAMLDTHVKKFPDGSEVGTYYALDFGGSNIRAVQAQLKGNGQYDINSKKKSIQELGGEQYTQWPRGLLDSMCPAECLFDELVSELGAQMQENGDAKKNEIFQLGFTFSFPCFQNQLQSSTCLAWTKGFETGRKTDDPVEGQDVCLLLQTAMMRKKLPVNVAAALNDTTGTFLSAAYELKPGAPSVGIGLILGTGVNACYREPSYKRYNYIGRLINTEVGNFNKALPKNIIDLEVDEASTNCGNQLFEKMVSGYYLGELCRRVLCKVFQHRAPEMAWCRYALSADAASYIYNDQSPDRKATKEVLKVQLDWDTNDQSIIDSVCALVTAVFERSAALVAAMISALSIQTGRLQRAAGGLTVAVDGSLWTQNPRYQSAVKRFLAEFLGDRSRLVHMTEARDGSGTGAALLACCAGTRRSSLLRDHPIVRQESLLKAEQHAKSRRKNTPVSSDEDD